MGIETKYVYIPTCDKCGEAFDDESEFWSSLEDWREELTDSGWLVKGNETFCPDCHKEWQKAMLDQYYPDFLVCRGHRTDNTQCAKCMRYRAYVEMFDIHDIEPGEDLLLPEPRSGRVLFHKCENFIDGYYHPITECVEQ